MDDPIPYDPRKNVSYVDSERVMNEAMEKLNKGFPGYVQQFLDSRAMCGERGHHLVSKEISDPKSPMIGYPCDAWFGINDGVPYKVAPLDDSPQRL